MNEIFHMFFMVVLVILALLVLLCLLRAIIGPRVTDRIIAANMLGTMVMVMIGILAIVLDEGYLVDICIIYAMISFLAVVVFTKVYTGVYLDAKEKNQTTDIDQIDILDDEEDV
ncbi:MAG: monovalent cation/H+ antiporter complex subunit F [Eubacteriales bacterium]|nr:monovalent cation/H+ antiporter complex subunit F [Lachnospiraceae bacterium]MDO5127584.1 monovalent cation/H+ antiporter complex subunit F [Eubacteriales bacterium]